MVVGENWEMIEKIVLKFSKNIKISFYLNCAERSVDYDNRFPPPQVVFYDSIFIQSMNFFIFFFRE